MNFTLFWATLHSRGFPRFCLHSTDVLNTFIGLREHNLAYRSKLYIFVFRYPHTSNKPSPLTRTYLYIKNKKIS